MGEITAPSASTFTDSTLFFSDVAVDNVANPTAIRVHLRFSKTDPFGKGVDLFVGRTDDDLCPVAAVLAYLAVRGGDEGPLFCFQNGQFLTRDRLVAKVREALEVLGLQSEQYAGHSFQIGAATTAAERGLEDSLIKALGRWESTAYLTYIQTPRSRLAAVSRRLSATRGPGGSQLS